jgi:hypothetical protein
MKESTQKTSILEGLELHTSSGRKFMHKYVGIAGAEGTRLLRLVGKLYLEICRQQFHTEVKPERLVISCNQVCLRASEVSNFQLR